MFGLIPQTWCDEEIVQLCAELTGRKEIVAKPHDRPVAALFSDLQAGAAKR